MSAVRKLRALVVDDSAVMRQILAKLLEGTGDFLIDTAADPLIAFRKIEAARPDVILLDLEMPRMDGLTFLRKLRESDPIPVVVCSALAGKGTETGFRAIEEGAVEVVVKPRVGLREFLEESTVLIGDALRGASLARGGRRRLALAETRDAIPSPLPLRETTDKVIAIGASTGGTEALRELLVRMPPDCPGIVVVQHMPEGYTRAFADRLDQICAIEVKEAASGDRVAPGKALIARGNHHLTLRRSGAAYVVEVDAGPLVSHHRPSVDVLFRSVAEAAGGNAVGVLLTGMGRDGAAGMLDLQRAGASTIAQDEATSVVFGMPKEAIALGAADEVLPLGRIAAAMIDRSLHKRPIQRGLASC